MEVKNPLDPPEGELPLLPGAFVRVEIDGKQAQDVATVPRNALVDGDQVWVVAEDDTIAPRSLTISWSDDTNVYATDGVRDGERLLVTDLPTLIKGMPVRVSDSRNTLAEAESTKGKEPVSDAG